MRIRTANGNDIHIMARPNSRWAIEQGHSHILIDESELRALVEVLTECVTDFQPSPRIQRFVNGVEQL